MEVLHFTRTLLLLATLGSLAGLCAAGVKEEDGKYYTSSTAPIAPVISMQMAGSDEYLLVVSAHRLQTAIKGRQACCNAAAMVLKSLETQRLCKSR